LLLTSVQQQHQHDDDIDAGASKAATSLATALQQQQRRLHLEITAAASVPRACGQFSATWRIIFLQRLALPKRPWRQHSPAVSNDVLEWYNDRGSA
jgi:hypothetical protein